MLFRKLKCLLGLHDNILVESETHWLSADNYWRKQKGLSYTYRAAELYPDDVPLAGAEFNQCYHCGHRSVHGETHTANRNLKFLWLNQELDPKQLAKKLR